MFNENTVDLNQLVSKEASDSGSTLFPMYHWEIIVINKIMAQKTVKIQEYICWYIILVILIWVIIDTLINIWLDSLE